MALDCIIQYVFKVVSLVLSAHIHIHWTHRILKKNIYIFYISLFMKMTRDINFSCRLSKAAHRPKQRLQPPPCLVLLG